MTRIIKLGTDKVYQLTALRGTGRELIAMADLNLSARAYDRILKESRTIVDLASSERILSDHVGPALSYGTK